MAIDHLDSIRVLTKKETLHATGLSEDTWDRLKERGETPPETQLSERPPGLDPRQIDHRKVAAKSPCAAPDRCRTHESARPQIPRIVSG